jgi:hypothetical protein
MEKIMNDERVAPVPPRSTADIMKDYWPFITAAAIALWAVFTWSADQVKIAQAHKAEAEQQAEVRLFEARKPFLEQQLALFLKTAEVTGRLVTLSPADPEWAPTKASFLALRWSEIEMVGDPGIRQAMRRVQYALLDVEKEVNEIALKRLRWMTECLADELRLSLENSWGNVRPPTETASGEMRVGLPNGCQQGPELPPPLPN